MRMGASGGSDAAVVLRMPLGPCCTSEQRHQTNFTGARHAMHKDLGCTRDPRTGNAMLVSCSSN